MARRLNTRGRMRVVPAILSCALLVAAAGCRPPGYGEGDDVDDAPDAATGPDAAPGPDAAAPDATASCEAAFRLEGHGTATSVLLTGDFVAWAGTTDDGALALTLGGDGVWIGTRTMPAGTWQYKFIVDGSWIADPGNPNGIDDGFGGQNSLYTCP